MADHHHGYLWLGDGNTLLKDGPRRSIHPEFRSASVVPLETAEWLLKPASFIRGTFREPKDAVDWYEAQLREHVGAFTSEHEREEEVISGRLRSALDVVIDGQDVVGGWWLSGQRFLSVSLIGCQPHRFRPTWPCPQPPR